MTVRITHTKVSGKPAGADPDRVYGTHWDDDHTVSGLTIGTDVQAYDATLAAWAAYNTNGILTQTAADTFTGRTITGTAAEITATNGDGVSGNPTLSLPTALTFTGKTVTGGTFSGMASGSTATTQSARDNSTKLATTAYVDTATREKLSAARTYYVRTDGSNANNGLANTAGGAWLTLQYAYDYVCSNLDLGGQTVTISVANGTYTGPLFCSAPWTGGGAVTISGSTSAILSTTSSDAINISCTLPGILTISGLKITTATAGCCIIHNGSGSIYFTGTEFGSAATYHQYVGGPASVIVATGNYTITGSASAHGVALGGGKIDWTGRTVTLTGTPAFAGLGYAFATRLGFISAESMTFSGSATGVRYNADTAAGIATSGGGATYFPGNSAGSATSPGWYT